MEIKDFMRQHPQVFRRDGMEPASLPKAILADVLTELARLQEQSKAADPHSAGGPEDVARTNGHHQS